MELRQITFEVSKVLPSPMSDPKYQFHWTKNQSERPRPWKEWSDCFDKWFAAVGRGADEAMMSESRLFSGLIRIDIVIYWKRPDKHFQADGMKRGEFIDDAPIQDPPIFEIGRVVAAAMERKVYYNINQIDYAKVRKVWGENYHNVEIKVSQVRPRDIDDRLTELPEQMELEL